MKVILANVNLGKAGETIRSWTLKHGTSDTQGTRRGEHPESQHLSMRGRSSSRQKIQNQAEETAAKLGDDCTIARRVGEQENSL
jgi:hypothetical protein